MAWKVFCRRIFGDSFSLLFPDRLLGSVPVWIGKQGLASGIPVPLAAGALSKLVAG